MIDILNKDIITEYDINQLIELKVEESIYLDFKQSGALEKNDKKKAELAKDVSSFANSAGGFIVYGICENNHVADSLSFIDGNEITKEWIEQVIQTRIQRKIEGLKIIPVRFDKDIKKTIYVIKVPESSLAPHMTSEKRYYKRYNFESVQMEEYEIRLLYNRTENSSLKILGITFNPDSCFENDDPILTCYFHLGFQIQNIGNVMEKYYKLEICPSFNYYSLKWDKLEKSQPIFSVNDDENRIISFANTCPIFPNEILNVGNFDLGIEMSMIETLLQDCKINLTLYYSNGKEELIEDLRPLIYLMKKTNT